ncbi:MAG: hypothetical protein ACFCUR_09750 [Rhodomicrobiaceae bacterium]
MWQALFEIVPKPAILALAIYGALSWFVTGPLVAERTAAIHHYPACLAGMKARPRPGAAREKLLDGLKRSPLFQAPLMQELGLDTYFELIEQQGQAAATRRLNPEQKCGCLIAHAIDRSRTAWAVYAATLRQVAWADVARFETVMSQIETEGLCHG